ncbi:heterochromatin protein 1-like [Hibiscus syriacus]|uniref:heterochromatin protein 1-like n=1 Tax=Hibiscus syriacus TaxID=106335 RepID=UPI001922BF4F|nr:heterochromatin protein 1-like [Hibiscus syriacus]
MEELDRGKSHRAPVGVKVSYEREVEAIHAERAVHGVGKRPRHEYLVQWKGLPESEGSWEPSEALWQFRDKIDQFHSSSRNEGVARTSGGECHRPPAQDRAQFVQGCQRLPLPRFGPSRRPSRAGPSTLEREEA